MLFLTNLIYQVNFWVVFCCLRIYSTLLILQIDRLVFSLAAIPENFKNDFFSWSEFSYWTIVYKKIDDWFIDWQRVTMSGTTSDNECQRVVQWTAMNDNERQRVTTNDNEWQWMITSDNKWQRMAKSGHFG